MNRSKKRLSLVPMLALLLAVVTACTGGNAPPAQAPSDAGAASPSASPSTSDGGATEAPASTETAPFRDGKYDPPVVINTVFPIADDIQYFNGENADNNILFEQAKKHLGLDIKVLWSAPTKNDGYKTKMLLSLASGEKLPDVINTRGDIDLTNRLIDSGKFMDLTDAIEQYASDDVKRIYDENPFLFHSVTRDGRVMALPIPTFGPNGPPIMFIRQDWLDNLGLQAPTTIAEMEAVLEAFTNGDPNRNGDHDTYGLALQLKNPAGDVMADTTALFGAFGAIPDMWRVSEDGQSLIYDAVQPEMKEALATLRDWMAKGYISKDAPQQDGGTATQLFASGKAGIVFGPNWFPYWPFPDLLANVEGASYKAYPVPAGPDGKVGRRAFQLLGATLLVNKDFKHPDAIFKYAQAMYELGRDSAVWDLNTKMLISNGYEAEGAAFQVAKYGFMPSYFIDPWHQVNAYLDIMAKGQPGRTPGEQEMFDGCLNNPLCIDGQVEAMGVWRLQKEADTITAFVGPTTATQKTQGDYLSKLEYETIVKIIFGTSPLDEFESFVERWKANGGDAITNEVNDWYKQNILKN